LRSAHVDLPQRREGRRSERSLDANESDFAP
jgi:hypothetical protein